MICTPDQVKDIIKNNPNKALITHGTAVANKLMLHLFGKGLKQALTQDGYFEAPDVFASRNADAISNKDLFQRLLQREDMVFTAQGGASFYTGLDPAQTVTFDAYLDKIRFGMTVRTWVKEFALKAYRSDPASVIFMEMDSQENVYPTYKSIFGIYDYLPNGRTLEYIVFKLTVKDCINYGIKDDFGTNNTSTYVTNYFRFVDDAGDRIYKWSNSTLTLVEGQVFPIAGEKVPGFIVSDLIDFDNTQQFCSPLGYCVELADCYFRDRSVRDLSKKYTGFPKSVEPLLTCSLCIGTGMLSGKACPSCTPVGADRGTGYKLITKVADVARFPLNALKEGFDVRKVYAYISPPVETWNKQDTSLADYENQIRDVYWGSYSRQSTTGPTVGETGLEETATKTLADLQPIYARLNMTADWAQSTENLICSVVGLHKYPQAFKSSNRTYGRYYILETPEQLSEQYLEAKAKKAPQFMLFDILQKYYQSLYQTNKQQLAIKLKLIRVEPFVHKSDVEVLAMNPSKVDFYCKIYFSEWLATKLDDWLLAQTIEALTLDLVTYATEKMVKPEDLITPPVPTIGFTESNQNRTTAN